MYRHVLALPLIAAIAATLLPVHGIAQARPTTMPAGGSTHAAHVLLNASEIVWGNAPASLPPGAEAAVIEGNPAEEGPFTLRLRLPDGYRVMPHSHPGVEHVTVLSGAFFVGTGETADFERMKELQVGGFMVMSPNSVHYARAQGKTIIQLHGVGPWAVNYVNPSDDPRKKQ